MSFSESGSTSQNARAKSNGVCEIAQKFAYVRGRSGSSSGTIVKLICLRSVINRSGGVRPADPLSPSLARPYCPAPLPPSLAPAGRRSLGGGWPAVWVPRDQFLPENPANEPL